MRQGRGQVTRSSKICQSMSGTKIEGVPADVVDEVVGGVEGLGVDEEAPRRWVRARVISSSPT